MALAALKVLAWQSAALYNAQFTMRRYDGRALRCTEKFGALQFRISVRFGSKLS